MTASEKKQLMANACKVRMGVIESTYGAKSGHPGGSLSASDLFMIQGGCPDGTGMGGPGYCIKGEFAANGVPNDLRHTRGVLSMARAQAMDSAGSQFFIMHKDAPHLDGQYAAFGMVIDGMDVVDEIVSQPRNMITNKPKKPQVAKAFWLSAICSTR